VAEASREKERELKDKAASLKRQLEAAEEKWDRHKEKEGQMSLPTRLLLLQGLHLLFDTEGSGTLSSEPLWAMAQARKERGHAQRDAPTGPWSRAQNDAFVHSIGDGFGKVEAEDFATAMVDTVPVNEVALSLSFMRCFETPRVTIQSWNSLNSSRVTVYGRITLDSTPFIGRIY